MNDSVDSGTAELGLPLPTKPELLKSQVGEILKEAIFSGKLKPGQTLAEIRLAKSLDVSQATIREALAQLEQVGIVVRIPNRSTVVTRLSAKEIQDRIRMRLLLEEMALLDAAPLLNETDYQQLNRYSEEIDDALARNSRVEASVKDLRFHRFLWQKSGSAVLLRVLEQLTTPLFAFLGLLHKLRSEQPLRNQPHQVIIAALRSGNAALIRQSLHEHIAMPYRQMLEVPPAELQKQVDRLEAAN